MEFDGCCQRFLVAAPEERLGLVVEFGQEWEEGAEDGGLGRESLVLGLVRLVERLVGNMKKRERKVEET